MFIYINVTHVFADYSTYNKYGDKGVLEVVDYFKQNNISAEKIASYTHIGSYMGLADYSEITFYYYDEKTFEEEIINKKRVEFLAIWEKDITRIGEKNMGYFELVKKIGSYNIFKKKEAV